MYKIYYLILLVVTNTSMLISQSNVKDYYLSLPEHLLASYNKASNSKKLSNFIDAKKFRESIISIEDIKNDYMILSNKTISGGGYIEIKIFRTVSKEDILVIADKECDEYCSGKLEFLKKRNQKWVNVTFDYLPKFNRFYDKVEVLASEYDLPRYGKNIQEKVYLKDGSGTKNYYYRWNGKKFTKALFIND